MASTHFSTAINLRVDPEQIAKIRAELVSIRNGVPRAIAPAINKTLAKAQTTLIDELVKTLDAKRGNILGKKDNRRIRVVKASQNNLSGRLQIMSRKIGLANFSYTETRRKKGFGNAKSGKGIKVAIYRDRPTYVLPHAFVAVGKSNNKHIFERVMKGGKRAARLPIASLKGISLHTVWTERPSIRGRVQGRIYEELPKDIASQVDRLLNRKKS